MRRFGLVLILLGTLICSGLASSLPQDTNHDQFGTVVEATHIQVFVDDEGADVPELQLEDFTVLVDGEERPVISVHPVDATRLDISSGGAEPSTSPGVGRVPGAALSTAIRRRFILFLDLASMTRPGLRNSLRAATEFLEHRAEATDLVGLTVYSPRRGLEHEVPMTTDHARIVEALDALGAGRAAERHDAVAEGIPIEEFAELASEEAGTPEGTAREEFLREMEESRLELQAETMLAALGRMSRGLRALGAPVHVLLFSRGLPDLVLRDPGARQALERTVREAEAAGVVLHTFQPDNLPVSNVHDPAHMQSRWRPGSERPAGLPAWAVLRDRAVLHFLAGETGGRSAFFRHALSEGLETVEEATRHYYVLALPLREDDVDMAPIEVRVRIPDVSVRWAPRRLGERLHDDPGTPARVMRLAEALDLRQEASQLMVDTVALPFQRDAGAELGVWLTIDAATIRELAPDAEPGSVGFELFGMVTTRWGGVVDHFRGRVRLQADPAPTRASGLGALRFFQTLAVEPGDYFVKLLVRETSTGSLFSRSLSWMVPVEHGGLGMTGPVLVERLGGRGLIDGTTEDASAGRAEAPLSVDGAPLLPRGRRGLLRGEELELFVQADRVARDPASGSFRLQLALELIGTDGSSTRVPPVVVRQESRPGGSERLLLRARIPESIPPGDYSLRVHLDDEIAEASAVRETSLRVLPRD